MILNQKRRISLLFILSFWGTGTLFTLLSRFHRYSWLSLSAFPIVMIIWAMSVRQRSVDQKLTHILMHIGSLIVFFLFVRGLRYNTPPEFSFIARNLWYLYYLPMLSIPQLMFRLAVQLGNPRARSLRPFWLVLYSINLLLLLLFLTNDFHQLAFRFTHGFDQYNTYVYGPVYYAGVDWMVVLLLASYVLILYRTTIRVSAAAVWVPLLVPIVCILYFLNYPRLNAANLLPMQLPEVFCFMIATMVETNLMIGLIPSNIGYIDFFDHSHLNAWISDANSTIRFGTKNAALSSRLLNDNEGMVLHTNPISGGQVTWAEDLSGLLQLNRDLEEVNQRLAEEHDLLIAENQLMTEQAQLAEQNRIYDTISAHVSPQMDRIFALLRDAEKNPDHFADSMALCCLLTVYIKRHANLMLLASQQEVLSSHELQLCLAESIDYLNRCKVPAACISWQTDDLPADGVLTLYDAFEAVLEAAMPGLSGLVVRGASEDGRFTLRLTMDTPASVADVRMPGLDVSVRTEEETVYMAMSCTQEVSAS